MQGKSPSDPWAVVYKPDGNFYVCMAFFNHTETLICRRPALMIEALCLQTNKPVKIKTTFCFKVCFAGNNTKPNSSHYIQKRSKLSPRAPYLGNPIISATKTIRDQALCQSCPLRAESQGVCTRVFCRWENTNVLYWQRLLGGTLM